MVGITRFAAFAAAAAVSAAAPLLGAPLHRESLLAHSSRAQRSAGSSRASSSAASRAAAGMAAYEKMRGDHKTEYYGTITVGEPAQEFTVIFDTGSGNLILPGQNCDTEACTQHRRYDMDKSKGAFKVGVSGEVIGVNPGEKSDATIKFGTGSVHGQLVQDQVCLASGNVCPKVHFISADSETNDPFLNMRFDGIMGLGFKALSVGDGFNMVDDMVDQRQLPQNQFSMYLDDDDGSEVSFGGFKPSLAASPVHWVPVSKQGYWQIAINDVAISNQPAGLCEGCQVAVDSGTSALAGPPNVVKAIAQQLNVAQDCSNFNDLPLLGFAVNGKVLNLRPNDYVDRGVGGCALSVMPLDMGEPIFVFGDPFLRRFLTVYDRDGPQVGFAVSRAYDVDDTMASSLMFSLDGGNSTNATEAGPAGTEAVYSQDLGAELLQRAHRPIQKNGALVTVKMKRAPKLKQ